MQKRTPIGLFETGEGKLIYISTGNTEQSLKFYLSTPHFPNLLYLLPVRLDTTDEASYYHTQCGTLIVKPIGTDMTVATWQHRTTITLDNPSGNCVEELPRAREALVMGYSYTAMAA